MKMIDSSAIFAHKSLLATLGSGAWYVLAQVEDSLSPIGGNVTIISLLMTAIYFLVKEIRDARALFSLERVEMDKKIEKEREKTETHRQETITLLKEIADDYKKKREADIEMLRKMRNDE